MIELKNIARSFGSVQALTGISVFLKKGERLSVLGPSGSGKTTLLRLIAGLEVPDVGAICIDGHEVSRPNWVLAPHLRGIGFVFQKPGLWPHMTVAQNVVFPLGRMRASDRKTRLEEVLLLTGLSDLAGRFPSELSGGQERRVALARAIASRPQILLMDEPLTNLDPDSRSAMLDLIVNTVSQQVCTLVYVTHDVSEVEMLSGRIAVLENGRMIHKQ